MRDQKTVKAKERLHALYLLKSGAASGVGHAAYSTAIQIKSPHKTVQVLSQYLDGYTTEA